MTLYNNTRMLITLTPPGLYDSNDPEWQEICKNIYEELKAVSIRENLGVTPEPERIRYQKSGEWFELYDKILLPFGGVTALGTALKYLFDKLIELHKQRNKTERAKKINIQMGDNSFVMEGFNQKEASRLIQAIEAIKPAEVLPETTDDQ